jgi:hypothetical protein
MSIHPLRVGAPLALSLLLASGAGATTLSGLSISNSSTNVFNDGGPPYRSVAQSSTSLLSSGATGFDMRYGAVVGADAGNATTNGGTYTQSMTGTFTITFSVTQNAGWNWSVNVDVVRNGALTIVNDPSNVFNNSGHANVTLNALSVVHSGAGVLGSSLNLGAVGTLSNAGAPASSPNQAFSQTSSAAITGVGTGGAQVVTLVFTFTATANSVDPVGGPREGDEAALRMGYDSTLQTFTADDYPGVPARLLANDGIFVSAAVPEPAAEALLALGLIGLAWFEKRRSPPR